MPFYLAQWTYRSEQMKAFLERPEEREDVARRAVEAFGGKLHQFHFAFGKHDGVAIAEFPDNERAAAFAMSVVSGGAFTAFKTTPLLSPKEAAAAMRRAGETDTGYRPPSG